MIVIPTQVADCPAGGALAVQALPGPPAPAPGPLPPKPQLAELTPVGREKGLSRPLENHDQGLRR